MAVLLRDASAERTFNYAPFWSYRAIRAGRSDLLTQNIMNVFAFVPIGFLLGCSIDRMKWWKALLIGCCFSLLLEVLHFVLKRGFAEYDDVWHNLLGCAIGYGIYVGVLQLIEGLDKK